MTDTTNEQTALLMRHLNIYERNKLIQEAHNAIDARHLFAARDFEAYQERIIRSAVERDAAEEGSPS